MSWFYKKTSTILKHDIRVIDTQVVNFYIVHTNYKILFFEFNSKQLRSDYDPKKVDEKDEYRVTMAVKSMAYNILSNNAKLMINHENNGWQDHYFLLY